MKKHSLFFILLLLGTSSFLLQSASVPVLAEFPLPMHFLKNNCLLCNKTFTITPELIYHIRTVHAQNLQAPFACSFCQINLTTSFVFAFDHVEKHLKANHQPQLSSDRGTLITTLEQLDFPGVLLSFVLEGTVIKLFYRNITIDCLEPSPYYVLNEKQTAPEPSFCEKNGIHFLSIEHYLLRKYMLEHGLNRYIPTE